MRFAAFAITYERPSALKKTLEVIQEQGERPEKTWIIDNSASHAVEQMVAELGRADVVYHRVGRNAGPAGAAAIGLRLARAGGYDWAYWIDDDDPPKFADTLPRLVALIENNAHGALGAVAAVGSRFSWQKGVLERIPDEHLVDGPVSVDFAAGGQQFIINTRAAEAVGWLESELFFGAEELDLCLRLRKAGYSLLVDGQHMRQHRELYDRVGVNSTRRIVSARTESTVWREYYSTRNYIHLMRQHDRQDLAFRGAVRSAAKIAASWTRGPKFGSAYTRATLRGIVDGYRGRLGLTVSPVKKTATAAPVS